MDAQDLRSGLPVRGRIATLLAVAALALTASISPVQQVSAAQATESNAPRNYSPQLGPLFNDPLSDAKARRINRHIRWSIESVPKGERIRIFSWNISSDAFEKALIHAHQRGVSVRVLMSNGIADSQDDTGSYRRLKRALAQHQASRRPSQKSWVRTCTNSCRGKSGAAHSKFFLFSKVGKRHDVVMVGSPNMTRSAALNQWNELITFTNRPTLYSTFISVFDQSAHDQPVTPPYVTAEEGDTSSWFTPYTGPPTGDPVLALLGNVKCKGATHRSGINGFTKIRIAGDAFVGDRGLRIAEKIRQLNNWGCNIKLLYAVMGKRIASTLFSKKGRGPVRARHYVQDLDCDGLYDNYIHMKSIAISGHYGTDTSTYMTLNGSNNWSGFGAASDDAGLVVEREGLERKYADWIDHLWKTKPPYRGTNPEPCPEVTTTDDTFLRATTTSTGAWGPDHEALTSATRWKYAHILE